jgi:hypothetical protein
LTITKGSSTSTTSLVNTLAARAKLRTATIAISIPRPVLAKMTSALRVRTL